LAEDLGFLENMSTEWWTRLANAANSSARITRTVLKIPSVTYDLRSPTSKISKRLVTVLSFRAPRAERARFFEAFLADYTGDDFQILSFCQREILSRPDFGQESWRQFLPLIAKAYEQRVTPERQHFGTYMYHARVRPELADSLVQEIAGNADKYPGFLVSMADTKMRKQIAPQIVPVGRVAAKEGWFAKKKVKRTPR